MQFSEGDYLRRDNKRKRTQNIIHTYVDDDVEDEVESDDMAFVEPRGSKQRHINVVASESKSETWPVALRSSVRTLKSRQRQSEPPRTFCKPRFLLDSGAKEHRSKPSHRALLKDVIEYAAPDECPKKLVGATGDPIAVTTVGDLNAYTTEVYECNVDQGLISSQKYRDAGLMTIILPRHLYPNHGAVVLDDHGKVLLVSDSNLTVDICTMGTHDIHVPVPDLTSVVKAIDTRTINAVYGLPSDVPSKDIVLFLQESFLCSKIDLLWLATSGAMIKRYYRPLPCKIAGTLQARKTDSTQFMDDDDRKELQANKRRACPHQRFDPARCITGKLFGTDWYGPVGDIFIDKASGFGHCNFVRHPTKKPTARGKRITLTKKDSPKLTGWAQDC